MAALSPTKLLNERGVGVAALVASRSSQHRHPLPHPSALVENRGGQVSPSISMVSFESRELFRAILAIAGLYGVFLVLGNVRFKYWRWCAGSPHACWQLSGWSGRSALPLDGPRQLLVIGTLGGGTTATAHELASLGLQVKHESSDSLANKCRDGTVSWAHSVRYIEISKSEEREAMISRLCSKARHHAWSAMMFDGGSFGAGFECTAHSNDDTWWDECWAAECRRVASREIGCAAKARQAGAGDVVASNQRSCTSPFEQVLLQVRHPLRTVESNVAAFCRGHDSTAAARQSLQLDTLETLLGQPPPRPPPHLGSARRLMERTGRPSAHTLANLTASITVDGECSRRFGWFWVRLLQMALPRVSATFRVEDTSPCAILRLSGVLPPPSSASSPQSVPHSRVPVDVALRALGQCRNDTSHAASANASKCHTCSGKQHGAINHKNGAHPGHSISLSYHELRVIDPELSRQMTLLAKGLGYE